MLYCAIVDAYSSGNMLAPAFRAEGCRCLHVQSTPAMSEFSLRQYQPDSFEAEWIHDGPLIKTVEWLRKQSADGKLLCVIPGSESGVELADALAGEIGLDSANDRALSAARRDKSLMGDALRHHQPEVRAIPHLATSDREQFAAWCRHALEAPSAAVVVKPLKSSGTDGVRRCVDESEALRAFDVLIGKVNGMGLINEQVLAQVFIRGTEYVVDTVSCRGHHVVADIRRYSKLEKNRAPFVYDRVDFIGSKGPLQDRLVAYVCSVLDALRIRFGPAHAELIVNENEEPILIEIGARLCGGWAPRIAKHSIGHGQVDLTVEAYLYPERFLTRERCEYEFRKPALTVFLISHVNGRIKQLPIVPFVRRLGSYLADYMFVTEGGMMKRTVDFVTAPGIVDLVADDKKTLEADYATIRSYESAGGYDVEPE